MNYYFIIFLFSFFSLKASDEPGHILMIYACESQIYTPYFLHIPFEKKAQPVVYKAFLPSLSKECDAQEEDYEKMFNTIIDLLRKRAVSIEEKDQFYKLKLLNNGAQRNHIYLIPFFPLYSKILAASARIKIAAEDFGAECLGYTQQLQKKDDGTFGYMATFTIKPPFAKLTEERAYWFPLQEG